MIINKIKTHNISLLKTFINLNNSTFFRYYDTRDITIIKNHLITIIITNNDEIVGYGHLDIENHVWLGICVLEKHKGNGYGKKIMNHLINYAIEHNIEYIYLSVDKNNAIAKNMYDKFDFKVIQTNKKTYLMKKTLI